MDVSHGVVNFCSEGYDGLTSDKDIRRRPTTSQYLTEMVVRVPKLLLVVGKVVGVTGNGASVADAKKEAMSGAQAASVSGGGNLIGSERVLIKTLSKYSPNSIILM